MTRWIVSLALVLMAGGRAAVAADASWEATKQAIDRGIAFLQASQCVWSVFSFLQV